jgi:hypothetical protein
MDFRQKQPSAANQQRTCRHSFNHFVGPGKQGWRYCKAERLRSLEVDNELEFSRLGDRQVRRVGTLQNLVNVDGSLPILVDEIRSVCD